MEPAELSAADFPREVALYWLMLWAQEYADQLYRNAVVDAVYEMMTKLPPEAGCAGSC